MLSSHFSKRKATGEDGGYEYCRMTYNIHGYILVVDKVGVTLHGPS